MKGCKLTCLQSWKDLQYLQRLIPPLAGILPRTEQSSSCRRRRSGWRRTWWSDQTSSGDRIQYGRWCSRLWDSRKSRTKNIFHLDHSLYYLYWVVGCSGDVSVWRRLRWVTGICHGTGAGDQRRHGSTASGSDQVPGSGDVLGTCYMVTIQYHT